MAMLCCFEHGEVDPLSSGEIATASADEVAAVEAAEAGQAALTAISSRTASEVLYVTNEFDHMTKHPSNDVTKHDYDPQITRSSFNCNINAPLFHALPCTDGLTFTTLYTPTTNSPPN
ncbi:unnamed protein product [Phytophthora fragariaefolia]|uniref:Unnamed protein product n=1 Tax=Phytophthora fragariaefolia TaxID=1490495 RepID=A0A9W6YNL2_9STRA|nr:unnamed protein product [Phytophthora fragariaefolia]